MIKSGGHPDRVVVIPELIVLASKEVHGLVSTRRFQRKLILPNLASECSHRSHELMPRKASIAQQVRMFSKETTLTGQSVGAVEVVDSAAGRAEPSFLLALSMTLHITGCLATSIC